MYQSFSYLVWLSRGICHCPPDLGEVTYDSEVKYVDERIVKMPFCDGK